MDLQLTNVIQISVSSAQAGVGNFNTSNLGLFTREVPDSMSFGSLGYKLYLDPSDPATDFGTNSVTAKMANAIFSQQPNILAGGGYLCVMPFDDTGKVAAHQLLTLSAVPASGQFVVNFEGEATIPLLWNDNAAAMQEKIRALPGLGSVLVTKPSSTTIEIEFAGVGGDPALVTITGDTLEDSGSVAVTVTPSSTVVGTLETLAEAITRTQDLVQYFGIICTELQGEDLLLAAAAVVQPLNKIAFMPERSQSTVQPGGSIDQLATGNFKKTRGLFFGASIDLDALLFSSRYASRGLSTDFTGNNTTQTMHLKDMIGQQPDPVMTQTLLAQCQAAGADVYVSLQGVPKIFTSGANGFYDSVYNQQWIVGALQVAGFNALATADTKLPQTEDGVSVLKAAYRAVCEQGVTNQYLAPGAWTSSTTFGKQADFLRNISERGYYIYSAPVAQQLPVDRAARKAPLIQIALKEAGAIHSSSVIIYVNA